MKKTIKYNLDIFVEAIRLVEYNLHEFSCNAIRQARENLGLGSYHHDSAELRFYMEIFNITSTFDTEFFILTKKWPDMEELKETRLLALSLAYEIARLENNKKAPL